MSLIRRFWWLVSFVRRVGGPKAAGILAKQAPQYFALFKRLLSDPRVPPHAKAVLLGAGAFAVSPLNLPAFLPLIGVVDELGIALMAGNYFFKQVPPDVLAEHKRAVGLSDAT